MTYQTGRQEPCHPGLNFTVSDVVSRRDDPTFVEPASEHKLAVNGTASSNWKPVLVAKLNFTAGTGVAA